MAVEFLRTIKESEVRSTYLNLTDDAGRTYGSEFALDHKTRLLVIDGQGRRTFASLHHGNQVWGSITNWFDQNRIEAGDVVSIAYDPAEHEDGLPVLRLARARETHPPASPAEALQRQRPISEDRAEIPLGLEKQIEDFLVHNVGLLEPGLTLYVEEDREGRQYPTDVGVIDLLCRRSNGDFVVVELKRGRASDAVVGQISRYMGWVKMNLADECEVFGLILAADADEQMKYAVAAHPNLRARYMIINLELTDEPPK